MDSRVYDEFEDQVLRGMSLIRRVAEGFKPMIVVEFLKNGEIVSRKIHISKVVKNDERDYAFVADVGVDEESDGLVAKLLDKNDKPLFCRKISTSLPKGHRLEIVWRVTIPEDFISVMVFEKPSDRVRVSLHVEGVE